MSTVTNITAQTLRAEASTLTGQGGRKSVLRTVLAAPTRAIKSLVAAVRQRQQYHRTVSALADLDDRTLADIGLRRSEIPAVAAGVRVGDQAGVTGLWPRQVLPAANGNDRRAAA